MQREAAGESCPFRGLIWGVREASLPAPPCALSVAEAKTASFASGKVEAKQKAAKKFLEIFPKKYKNDYFFGKISKNLTRGALSNYGSPKGGLLCALNEKTI